MNEMLTMSMEEVKKGRMLFATLIRSEHIHGDNKFVAGKILGYAEVICDDEKRRARYVFGEDYERVLLTKCTPDEYNELVRMITKHYPGLCEFNYDINKVMIVQEKERKQKKEK